MRIKFIVGAFAVVLMSGCQAVSTDDLAAITTPADEGYQLGDTLDSVMTLQAKYCAETDPTRRAVYLKAVKSLVEFYPERGACTDLAELVGGKDAVNLIADNQLEVSKAIEEQNKYQEKLKSNK